MVLTLYYSPNSADCRQVILTMKVLNLDYNLKHLDLLNGEHLTSAEFVKLNPEQMVPTIIDGDFVLWESRAIARYLANKYGTATKLYPQEPRLRAVVDQRLDFDYRLYFTFGEYFYPQFFDNVKPDKSKLKEIEEMLGFLNSCLEGSLFVAGGDLTIADLALVATASTIEITDISLKPYPNVERWLALIKAAVPAYQEAVQKNLDIRDQQMRLFKDKQKK